MAKKNGKKCQCLDDIPVPPLPPGWVDPPDKPGFGVLVERYMPLATQEEKDAAYENVKQFVDVLVRIDERLGREAVAPVPATPRGASLR